MQENILNKIARKTAVFLLLLVILTPTVLKEVKIVALFLLAGSLMIHYLFERRIFIYKPFLVYSLICSILGLFFITHGLVKGHEGASSIITIMVAYPILYAFFLSLYQEGDYRYLEKFFVISLVLNLFIFVGFIFARLGFFPSTILDIYETIFGDSATFSFYNGMPQFALPSIQSLFFLLPFTIFYTVLGAHTLKTRILLYGLIFITCILVFFTGRRGLILMVVLSTIIMLSIYFLLIKRRETLPRTGFVKKIFFTILLFLLIGSGVYIVNHFEMLDVQRIVYDLGTILNFQDDPSNRLRTLQFFALTDGIGEHPLIGNGAGAVASVIRSEETPWAYELTYIAFAFHYGILAFVFYALGIIWLFISLIFSARKLPIDQARFLIGVAAGLLCFIMANSTNPYLGKFDFMWIIFFPASLISYYNLKNKI